VTVLIHININISRPYAKPKNMSNWDKVRYSNIVKNVDDINDCKE